MENCVSINSKQEKIIIKIAGPATHEEVINCMKEKIPQLSKMYQEEKIPILVVGKILKQKEMEEIKDLIKQDIDVEIEFDSPKEMGLSVIRKVYEKNTETSETKYYRGSLRCGQKIEFEGSLVIIGDVNGGAEVVAGENITVLGTLRGLAHAGAKGNKKAIIAANAIDAPQMRIANLVKEVIKEELQIKKYIYAYVKDEEIIIE